VQFGLLVSVLLHVAILGWALFTIQTQRELRVPDVEPGNAGCEKNGKYRE